MIEIRIHGRGGQGAVIASQILIMAAAKQGRKVQAFPLFGPERRGAPVAAFARVDDRKIWIHSQVYAPDCVIVLHPILYKQVDVVAGLKPGGWIVINSVKEPSSLPFPPHFKVATVDAGAIAMTHNLGSRAEPLVNTAILGAFARVTEVIGIEALAETIRETVRVKGEENEAAAREAFETVKVRDGGCSEKESTWKKRSS